MEDFKAATTSNFNQVSSRELTWFVNNDRFMSNYFSDVGSMHLSASVYTWFDPYSMYWFLSTKVGLRETVLI